MATTTSSAIPSTPVLGAGRAWLAPAGPAVALVVVVVACLWRLDRPLLWGDEADTAVSARGVLQHGCPVEFDGRNLSDFQNGGELNGDLVRIRVSWASRTSPRCRCFCLERPRAACVCCLPFWG